MVDILYNLTRKGRTVIMSIHQPRYSIFKKFDQLILLSNGETVYNGKAKLAIDYFTKIGHACEAFNNPADFFLDVTIQNEKLTRVRKEDGEDAEREPLKKTPVAAVRLPPLLPPPSRLALC